LNFFADRSLEKYFGQIAIICSWAKICPKCNFDERRIRSEENTFFSTKKFWQVMKSKRNEKCLKNLTKNFIISRHMESHCYQRVVAEKDFGST